MLAVEIMENIGNMKEIQEGIKKTNKQTNKNLKHTWVEEQKQLVVPTSSSKLAASELL